MNNGLFEFANELHEKAAEVLPKTSAAFGENLLWFKVKPKEFFSKRLTWSGI